MSRIGWLLIGLMMLSPAHAEMPAREWRALLARFVAALEGAPETRNALLVDFERADRADAVRLLLGAYRSVEHAVDRQALHERATTELVFLERVPAVLGTYRDAKAVQTLVSALRGRDASMLRAAARSFAVSKQAAGLPAIRALLANTRLPLRTRLPVVAAAGAIGDTSAIAPLAGHAGAARWELRLGVVRALAALGSMRALPTLIPRLEDPRAIVRHAAETALVSLTGHDHGMAPKLWSVWYERNRDAIEAGTCARGTAAAGKARGSTTTYHGIPIASDRLLFIVDVSLSMKTSYRGPGAPKPRTPQSRMDVAKRQLTAVIARLRPATTFNVLFFADRVYTWKNEPQPATPAHRADAATYVRKRTMEFKTNTYGALERAFELAGVVKDGAPVVLSGRQAGGARFDTVFVLSDGAPYGGKTDDTAQLLALVRRLNAGVGLTIHTIFIGNRRKRVGKQKKPNVALPFMKDLAAQNGGRFTIAK